MLDAQVVDTGIKNGISPYRDYFNTWAGDAVDGYEGLTNTQFPLVFGDWTIPRVTGPATGKFYSSTWVGLGGDEDTYYAAMPQTGTEQIASCSRFGASLFCSGTRSHG